MNAHPARLGGDRNGVVIPCSQSQKRFWFETQLHPDNPGLNVAVRWRLEGDVSHAQLEEAWRQIVARHQTLRTSFTTVDGEPRQVVEPSVALHVPLVDLTNLPDADAAAEADRVATLEAQRTFDITKAPLIRVTHVRVRSDVSMILVTAHHAVCDGWSVGILAREMGELCAAQHEGRSPNLPEISVTYEDYAAWEREWLSASNALDAEEDALAQTLDGFEQFEILPDKPRPPIQTANGEICSRLLDRSLTDALAELSRAHNCTLFMTAYAALLVLLSRYSGRTDIVLGTQIAGREEVDFEKLVGTFINTIALRTDVSGDPQFSELLADARDNVTDALEHRYVPLERLVEIVNPKRDLSRNALFSINFVYQRSFIQNQTYGAFKLVDLPSRSAGPICDLNFFMVERPEGWRTSCEFNTDLYRPATVNRMLDHFVALLGAVAKNPACRLSDLPMMNGDERSRVIAFGEGLRAAYERDASVPGVFAQQATRIPDHIAVIDESSALTYAQLERRSNRLARYLRGAGVVPGTTVGVALDRSIDVPIALLAILKAGAAYVPLEPAFPRERLAFIARDAALAVIVTSGSVRERLSDCDAPIVDLSQVAAAVASQPHDSIDGTAGPLSPAYVMYTSGSTGRPKGVSISHRAITRLVRATDYVEFADDDTVLANAPLGFDASTFEIWAPLLCGGRLAIAAPGVLSLSEIGRAIERFGVTTLWLTAAVFREMVDSHIPAFGRLRRLLAGGDVISSQHARRFIKAFEGVRLINGYGPTENTTFSCAYPVPSADAIGESVPIGRPIAHSTAYVLDTHLQPVPFGVVGELCVGGDGVALEYINLPQLTAERFVPDTIGGVPDARLYRTGDQARLRDDGLFEFVGRSDDQVKIRGFRIEPREIESVLLEHAFVADACVVARTSPSGDKALYAYIVPKDPTAERLSSGDLKAWVGERLPAFMIPTGFVVLERLPLTPNGKVDRSALPAATERPASEATGYHSATELQVAAILGELVGVEHIERDVDIFSLGFHSLLAVRFAARVLKTFGVELGLRRLFEEPTIAAIAAQIDEAPGDGAQAEAAPPIVTLNASGRRTPFIFFHGDFFADGLYAHRLAAAVGSDQPVHAVAPHGTSGLLLFPTIETMAEDYARLIRSVQPAGPYRLGGFCASGLVAYELARILHARGEVVERLVLINCSPMPKRRIAAFDWLVRRCGLDQKMDPRLRERLCYNLARLHAAAVIGPLHALAAVTRAVRSIVSRSQTPAVQEPQPFAKRRGAKETENSFAHLVAAFTYHPKAYEGEVSLVWGVEQKMMFDDPTMGWGEVATHVNATFMSGGHVAAIDDRIGELAGTVVAVLGG